MKKEAKSKKKMTDILLDINMADQRWEQALPNVSALMENAKTTAFDYVQKNADIDVLNTDKPLLIGVCLSDNAQVQDLNKQFRGLDKPTNVLSFANLDDPDFMEESQHYPEINLGNIILAYETMEKEAAEQQISLQNHFCHLLVHGFLHLLGYDHMEPADAAVMEAAEVAILAKLNIDNPYEED